MQGQESKRDWRVKTMKETTRLLLFLLSQQKLEIYSGYLYCPGIFKLFVGSNKQENETASNL